MLLESIHWESKRTNQYPTQKDICFCCDDWHLSQSFSISFSCSPQRLWCYCDLVYHTQRKQSIKSNSDIQMLENITLDRKISNNPSSFEKFTTPFFRWLVRSDYSRWLHDISFSLSYSSVQCEFWNFETAVIVSMSPCERSVCHKRISLCVWEAGWREESEG